MHYQYRKVDDSARRVLVAGRLALAAGKHVLCEKPLAMNARESAELVKLARQSGLAQLQRDHPGPRKQDVILAIDCIYMAQSMEPFFWTVQQLLEPTKGVVLYYCNLCSSQAPGRHQTS